jgi:hypothetical protein
MNRSLAVLLLLAALTSCRDYDLHSRLTNQDGLVPADRFARYGQEQAQEMAIARQLGSVMKGSSIQDSAKQKAAASNYARSLPGVADVQVDPLGYRLTVRFKSGWRTMVNPIEDGKGTTGTPKVQPGAGGTPRTR